MSKPTVALLYPGDRAMRDRSDPVESRFGALFEAFGQSDVRAVPAVYNEDVSDEVEEQLRAGDVKAWCNPIHEGRRRDRLDTLLRRLADSDILVSAHPEPILKLGTKDVLFDSRDLPFGSDVHRIDTLDQLKEALPERLRAGARVLKQHRGHSGIGVWRVEMVDASSPSSLLKVRHAQRGSEEECISLSTLVDRLARYFDADNGGI